MGPRAWCARALRREAHGTHPVRETSADALRTTAPLEGATEFTRELVGAEDPGIAFDVRLGGSALTIVARGTPSADAAALTAWMGRVQAAMQARLGG